MTDIPRILVTGSRDWDDEEFIFWALYSAWSRLGGHDIILVHGACQDRQGNLMGADLIANSWGDWRMGVEIEQHPADWDAYGDAAGPKRNADMVARGATLCMGFINPCIKPNCDRLKRHGSHGASGCVDLAVDAGIETWAFRTAFGPPPRAVMAKPTLSAS